MRIQFASQFFSATERLDFGRLLKPIAPTLLLLGNTVNPWTLGGRNFLRSAAANYDAVLLVAGPAEYAANRNMCYRGNLNRLYEVTIEYRNVHILNHKIWSPATGGSVYMTGATMWGPLNGFTAMTHPETACIRERVLKPGTDGETEEIMLQTIRDDVVRNMQYSDRNFLNSVLLEARARERAGTAPVDQRYVFGSYYLPHVGCMTQADYANVNILGMVNQYQYMMRRPLQMWLCGAGLGGMNYWDRDTGILFAKNARGDGDDPAAGYSAEMFMDIQSAAEAGVKDVRAGGSNENLLALVKADAEQAAAGCLNLPPVPAPDVDFYPEK